MPLRLWSDKWLGSQAGKALQAVLMLGSALSLAFPKEPQR